MTALVATRTTPADPTTSSPAVTDTVVVGFLHGGAVAAVSSIATTTASIDAATPLPPPSGSKGGGVITRQEGEAAANESSSASAPSSSSALSSPPEVNASKAEDTLAKRAPEEASGIRVWAVVGVAMISLLAALLSPLAVGALPGLGLPTWQVHRLEYSGIKMAWRLHKVNAELNITVNVMNPNVVPAVLRNASLSLFYADPSAGTPVKFGMVQVDHHSSLITRHSSLVTHNPSTHQLITQTQNCNALRTIRASQA
jgi:hypothetical protein